MEHPHKTKNMELKIDLFALTLVFVVLRVFGAIDWSWWWVFSPLWITFSLFIIFAIIYGVLDCIKDMKG